MTRLDNDLISRKALLVVLSNLSVKNITDDDTYELVEGLFEIFRKSITNAPTIEADSGDAVAHLWESIGRWSAYLVSNGSEANLAPPDWLLDAVKKATSPPKREWSELTDEQIQEIFRAWVADIERTPIKLTKATQAKLKEVNHG